MIIHTNTFLFHNGLSQDIKYNSLCYTAGPCLSILSLYGASQVALVIKKLATNAGDVRDVGSIPGYTSLHLLSPNSQSICPPLPTFLLPLTSGFILYSADGGNLKHPNPVILFFCLKSSQGPMAVRTDSKPCKCSQFLEGTCSLLRCFLFLEYSS